MMKIVAANILRLNQNDCAMIALTSKGVVQYNMDSAKSGV